MKVFIVTEGTRQTGYGHVTRCISMYEGFEARKEHAVLVVNGDNNAADLTRGYRIRLFNWLENPGKLYGIIHDADIVVIDSYLAGPDCYTKISDSCRLPVFIDDNIRLNYPRGIIVNGSIGAEHFHYPSGPGKTYLLGTDFQPIRQAFWNIPERKTITELKTILITFGGSDPRDLSLPVLHALVQHFPAAGKKVVTGKGFSNHAGIEQAADDNTQILKALNADEIRCAMLDSDLAVSAGGQTLYELAVSGTPVIIIGTAQNQKENIDGWTKSGFARFAGWWNDENTEQTINRIIHQLASDPSQLARMQACGKKFTRQDSTLHLVNQIINAATT